MSLTKDKGVKQSIGSEQGGMEEASGMSKIEVRNFSPANLNLERSLENNAILLLLFFFFRH